MKFRGVRLEPSSRNSPKTIELASTTEIDKFEEFAPDFFSRILDLDLNDCLITDESSLWDFHSETSNDQFYSKIVDTYGVDVSDVATANLAKIFQRIIEAQRQK